MSKKRAVAWTMNAQTWTSSLVYCVFTLMVVVLLGTKVDYSLGYKILSNAPAHDIVGESSESNVGRLRRRLDSEGEGKEAEAPRPIVYTFFQRIEEHFSTTSYDDGMLTAWANSWEEMGWEPRILTLDDAKKHPRYEEYNKALDAVELDTRIGSERPSIEEYNRLCYLRWLAMAANGGGFMADYDTVAVSAPRPGDNEVGQFTLYERTIPALISGSGEEWERLAWLILDYGIEHTKAGNAFSSDMVSLNGVFDNHTCDCKIFGWNESPVVDAQVPLSKKDFTIDDCEYLKKFRAIHFSHHALTEAYSEDPSFTYGMEPRTERPEIMMEFFNRFTAFCVDEQDTTG